MVSAGSAWDVAYRQGRAKKRNNAIVAIVSGVVPAIFISYFFQGSTRHWLVGLIVGLVWANGFEYAYHRWLLHRPRSSFSQGHRLHHSSLGHPNEPEHVTLGSSPLNIAILFFVNGALLLAFDALVRLGIAPGVFTGWTIYLIAAEEIHWRIHLNQWLPPMLHWTREYHFSHHDYPNARYNVFFPLFDILCGNYKLMGPAKAL